MRNWDKLEIYHSRKNAPTRRVAVPQPPEHPPTPQQLASLIALWAEEASLLSTEERDDLDGTLVDWLDGKRPASRLRHRLQYDTVGLQKTVFSFTPPAGYQRTSSAYISPQQTTLGLYLLCARRNDNALLRDFQRVLRSGTYAAVPLEVAKGVLGIHTPDFSVAQVKKQFRSLAKVAHPDLTLKETEREIQELVQAKNTLLEHLAGTSRAEDTNA